ncbi:MAG: galactose-1-phosphate uridylyltransferase [Acidobacteriia bacterium]|nr:galactose-1-phosphate uridylyltransferase [Terriglobia bacterium]
MELRKDPITSSWVVVGHREDTCETSGGCPFCPPKVDAKPVLLRLPAQGPWQVAVIPHPDPLYRVEGDPNRRADGIFDMMRPVGADEIVIETPDHERKFEDLSEDQILRVTEAWAERIQDLKRDLRFKYVSVFKNYGALAGQDGSHAHSEVTATIFVPRRILYELRAAREWYREKERCVFCDIVKQEERQGKRIVDTQGEYVALCPYASRVPYEIWVMDRKHSYLFEVPRPGANRRHLAVLLQRVLRRLRQVAPAYHLVVHTSPNTNHPKGEVSSYWKTIMDDYHWHIEILPIVETRSKSYSIKEVYFNALMPEEAAERLRQLDPKS